MNPESVAGVDEQTSARGAARFHDLGLRFLDVGEDLPRPGEIDVAFGGEGQPSRGAVKQPDAQAVLQAADELGYGRRRQPKGCRRC